MSAVDNRGSRGKIKALIILLLLVAIVAIFAIFHSHYLGLIESALESLKLVD